jgi:hypothetical protein
MQIAPILVADQRRFMKKALLAFVCTLALGGCQTPAATRPGDAVDANKDPNAIEITGSATTSMVDTPIVPVNPNVTVYPLDGPVQNPLSVERTHSVLENTTSGGYTVFDESVTVYPLPGDDVPAFMPPYAVPPLKGQPAGMVSASGLLPPVPNIDVRNADPYAKPPVSGAVRKPLLLTAADPVTLQPPSDVRPPLKSPFAATANPQPMMPILDEKDMEVSGAPMGDIPPPPPPGAALAEAAASAPPPPAPAAAAAPAVQKTATTPGRRSGPMLTDY